MDWSTRGFGGTSAGPFGSAGTTTVNIDIDRDICFLIFVALLVRMVVILFSFVLRVGT
jgi:hypothetical protein